MCFCGEGSKSVTIQSILRYFVIFGIGQDMNVRHPAKFPPCENHRNLSFPKNLELISTFAASFFKDFDRWDWKDLAYPRIGQCYETTLSRPSDFDTSGIWLVLAMSKTIMVELCPVGYRWHCGWSDFWLHTRQAAVLLMLTWIGSNSNLISRFPRDLEALYICSPHDT